MQIFNIGPVELILIILIMFILLGPDGMIKTARQIGTWVRELIRSPIWRDIMGYSREIRDLPTKIVRETGLDDDLAEIKKTTQEVNADLTKSANELNTEVQQSLKEAGTVDIRVDTNPPPASKPIPSGVLPGATSGPAASAPPKPAEPSTTAQAAQAAPAAPPAPVQTYYKYQADDDEEEEE